MKTLSLTEARSRLLRIAGEIERHPETVVEVSKRGKRLLALVSADLYDSLIETLELLGDEAATVKLRKAVREIEEGKGIPWQRARKRLGL